jgi:transposase InsO family protein
VLHALSLASTALQMLARAGLHLSASTVRRMLQRQPTWQDVVEIPVPRRGGIRADDPNHVWHIDLTTVPTGLGFWVPWSPFARPQGWPLCWWAVVVVDQFSRTALGIAVFKRRPASAQVCRFLAGVARTVGAPRHVITDKGKEFDCETFKVWCRKHSVRRRFGAVGQHGSIAVVERFIRSMKAECTRRIIVPFRLDRMQAELRHHATWYNEHRPHSALDGRTPGEACRGGRAASERLRFEPRSRWRRTDVPTKGKRGTRLTLVLGHVGHRAHLPVVELKRAA